MTTFPIFLDLRERSVILSGRGAAADAKRRLLERAGAQVVGEERDGALAIVAMSEPEPVVARLKARGILVNVVDRPDLSDFFMPAIVDRDPVIVAIGTGGVSAGLAAALRQRFEQILPTNLGRLAEHLRTLRARFPDAAQRRRHIDTALAPGGPLDPLTWRGDGEVDSGAEISPRLETLAIRSPDPDELTLRTARLLGLADRLYHHTYMPTVVLDRARADAERIIGPPPALLEPGLSIELVWMPE